MVFKGGRWVARYRQLHGTWSTKRLPAHLTPTNEGEARAWIVAWYEDYLRCGGLGPDNLQVKPSKRVTLRDLEGRWISYREGDPGTDPTYASSLKGQYANWIKGHKIADLDISTELEPLQIVQWIRSLRGAPASRMTVASTLSVMLSDAILHGRAWGVDPTMPHPMLVSPHVVRELDALRTQRKTQQVKPILSLSEVHDLLTQRTSKVWDIRRVKYLLALATGMRDRELQGLIWDDMKEVPTPHIWVLRQLVSPGPAPFLWLADVRNEHGPTVDLSILGQAVAKPPKRNSRRALPLTPLAVEVLSWWRSTGWIQFAGREPQSDDPIFPSGYRNRHQPHGQFCTPCGGALLLKDLDRLGLSPVYTSPHNGLEAHHTSRTLRHTFASLLSGVGIDDGRIGDLLGHSAATVTRAHYIEAVLAARWEVIRKLRLPDRVVFRAHVVEDPGAVKGEMAKVVKLGR